MRMLVWFLLAILSACGGASVSTSSPTSPSPNCTADGVNFEVTSADGYVRHAAAYGTGPAVIIAHQSDESRCDVLPIARWLRDSGYAAVAVDLYGDWTGVLAATIKAMRDRGSMSVQLLGASMGGCDAMVVASEVAPPVNSVVSLGGERRISTELNADTAVAHSHVPLLVVTSENDGFLTGAEARTLISESASTDKEAFVLPGSLHGFAMLDGPDGPRVRQTILAFLAAHARLT